MDMQNTTTPSTSAQPGKSKAPSRSERLERELPKWFQEIMDTVLHGKLKDWREYTLLDTSKEARRRWGWDPDSEYHDLWKILSVEDEVKVLFPKLSGPEAMKLTMDTIEQYHKIMDETEEAPQT